MIFAFEGLSGCVLGLSWIVLEASCAITDHVGGILDVVLALLNRLGNLVSEFLVVLGRFVTILGAQRGANFLPRVAPGSRRGRAGSAARGMGRPLETLQNLTRQLAGILTRPHRASTVADVGQYRCHSSKQCMNFKFVVQVSNVRQFQYGTLTVS